MPDLPAPPVSDAIAKLLSSVLPPRAYEYLFALIPGGFFGASVLAGDPKLVRKLFADSYTHLAFDYSTKLCLALTFAFLVGYAFMVMVFVVRKLLSLLQRLNTFIWAQFCRVLFLLSPPVLRMLNWTQRPLAVYFVRYLQDQYVPIPWIAATISDEDTRRCWARLARRLLLDRYGIKHENLSQNEWNVLYLTLGTVDPGEVHGSIGLVASEAAGWCGVAAIGLAPALANRNYLALCAFLVLTGLLNDYKIVERLNDPRYLGFLRVRALMREYTQQTHIVARHRPNAEPDANRLQE